MMTVKATPVIGRDLKPGDLFSNVGPEYWGNIDRTGSVGERVYIRTNTPSDNFPDAHEMVYRIEVVHETRHSLGYPSRTRIEGIDYPVGGSPE